VTPGEEGDEPPALWSDAAGAAHLVADPLAAHAAAVRRARQHAGGVGEEIVDRLAQANERLLQVIARARAAAHLVGRGRKPEVRVPGLEWLAAE
jgi:hypothetical protein